jgi:dTDP-4-amino-4,6-dideoxygalactose transaminase
MLYPNVPFFRPDISESEVEEVTAVLSSGWLTTGSRVRRFEEEFATATRAKYAIALNSCTAALHLAVEALELKAGQAVLVPTMTFAATAEIVRYLGGIPILVDCDYASTNMSLDDAAQKMVRLKEGGIKAKLPEGLGVVGLIPVHVGGMMMDIRDIKKFASQYGLWIVEDAAHAFPAAWRAESSDPWLRCGEATAHVSCFSFYANKTITTGEGGMAVTDDAVLAERMRLMSLHGLSQDAWGRYTSAGSWDYKIIAPGYKYNLTDIAGAIGIHQLLRAEDMRMRRERVARRYYEAFSEVEEIELPLDDNNRIHAWHLFPIRLRIERLSISRDSFIEELKKLKVGCSVHWRPLHLHPYYQETFGWDEEDFPVATELWKRFISLPIFPSMKEDEIEHVVFAVRHICARYRR